MPTAEMFWQLGLGPDKVLHIRPENAALWYCNAPVPERVVWVPPIPGGLDPIGAMYLELGCRGCVEAVAAELKMDTLAHVLKESPWKRSPPA